MAHSFYGGVHPNDQKAATNQKPIELLPPPATVVLPMSMHIGAPCAPLVAKGDSVKMGQKIADAQSPVSAPIHATVSGTVVAVEARPHPSGTNVLSVVIENDFQDTPADELVSRSKEQIDALSADELVSIIREAGIVGHGGAAFPTHLKISSGLGKVNTLIINGAECEPYITSDHRIMLEQTEQVLGGVQILKKVFGLPTATIGVEDNKMDAVNHLRSKIAECGGGIEVTPLHTRYPQGAEKQLIQALTGREVPPGGLPAAVGCAVFNVDTAAAVYRAVTTGMPVIRRIVTVSGSAIAEPRNLEVRIGTPLASLLEACGGYRKDPFKLIMGGPMMGTALFDLDVPVIKGTNAMLAFCEKEEKSSPNPTCIHCGKCIGVCPMRLSPMFMYLYGQKGLLEELEEQYHVLDCMECGSCSYICPGRLHLVQSFRTSKQLINNAKARAKEAAAK